MTRATVISERASLALELTIQEDGVNIDAGAISRIDWSVHDEGGTEVATGNAISGFTNPHVLAVPFFKTVDEGTRKRYFLHAKVTYASSIFGASAVARLVSPVEVLVVSSPQTT